MEEDEEEEYELGQESDSEEESEPEQEPDSEEEIEDPQLPILFRKAMHKAPVLIERSKSALSDDLIEIWWYPDNGKLEFKFVQSHLPLVPPPRPPRSLPPSLPPLRPSPPPPRLPPPGSPPGRERKLFRMEI